jgi:type VI secretion system protein ImpH
MAAQNGRTNTPLSKNLFDEPYRFDFFQAVRLLERIGRERQPVGRKDGDPQREVVRFRTRASLAFPPSQLYELVRDGAGRAGNPPELTVAFMGLTGPMGALPQTYTETIIERRREKDTTMWEFLDLFNHRLISLFYRAWEKYRFHIAYERDGGDNFTESLFALIGLGTRGQRGRMGLQEQSLLFYSGLIAQRPHSAATIQCILTDYFGVQARVEQCLGQWLKLDEDSLSRISGISDDGLANNALGVSAVLGSRVWDAQSKFRVRLGPLSYPQFVKFLPTGDAFKPVTELARLLAGPEFDFDLQLVIKAQEVFGSVLTTRAKRKPMLGWTTWLTTKPMKAKDPSIVLSVGN